MMLRRSPFRWLVLAGIMLFMLGYVVDDLWMKEENIHLVWGIPVQAHLNNGNTEKETISAGTSAITLKLDSIRIPAISPVYEIQLRETVREFNEQVHAAIMPPSFLKVTFPMVPMKIREIGNTEFRFRLKEFYPDFSFQYQYPEKQDTIPPRAPGITLNLHLPGREEVVTLRSDQPKLHKLPDEVGLGCSLEYYWRISRDSLIMLNHDTAKQENKIIFAGEQKKIYLSFDGKTDSLPLEMNRFYSVPGEDSLGFNILQSFPDIRWLKAVPTTKSDQLLNPVAEVEVWKIGGSAQRVFLYPNVQGRHGGEWKVPGTNLFLTCGLNHKNLVDACTCKVALSDSLQQMNKSIFLSGQKVISFNGIKIRLSECDARGTWANISLWKAPGHPLRFAGLLIAMAALLGYLVQIIKRH